MGERGGMCGQVRAEAAVLYRQSVLEGTSERKKKTQKRYFVGDRPRFKPERDLPPHQDLMAATHTVLAPLLHPLPVPSPLLHLLLLNMSNSLKGNMHSRATPRDSYLLFVEIVSE